MQAGLDRNRLDYWVKGEIPWINSGAVNQVIIKEPSEYITELGLKNSSAKYIPVNSLVMALAGQGKTKGMVAYTSIETTCNQSMAAIVPKNIIINSYIIGLTQITKILGI
jgi:type I restriction enzyme S subunit